MELNFKEVLRATWLRILGYDTLYFRGDDAELAAISRREERIILTRDAHLPHEKIIEKYLILKSEFVLEQLIEIIQTYNLLPVHCDTSFTRCLDCNSELSDIDKERVKDLVPEYVYNTQIRFHQCPKCCKIYWAGTHVEKTKKRIKEIFN